MAKKICTSSLVISDCLVVPLRIRYYGTQSDTGNSKIANSPSSDDMSSPSNLRLTWPTQLIKYGPYDTHSSNPACWIRKTHSIDPGDHPNVELETCTALWSYWWHDHPHTSSTSHPFSRSEGPEQHIDLGFPSYVPWPTSPRPADEAPRVP